MVISRFKICNACFLFQLIYPLYRFREAGFSTVTIGPVKGNTYKGKHGYPVKADLSVDDVTPHVSGFLTVFFCFACFHLIFVCMFIN